MNNGKKNYISIPNYSLFDRIVSIPYCPNKEEEEEFYFYSLFDPIDSIPYLTTIRNKEWNNVFVRHCLIYKTDVTAKTAVAQAACIHGNRSRIDSYNV